MCLRRTVQLAPQLGKLAIISACFIGQVGSFKKIAQLHKKVSDIGFNNFIAQRTAQPYDAVQFPDAPGNQQRIYSLVERV